MVAIEMIIQVGNQTEWRSHPTEKYPCGKPLPGAMDRIKALGIAAREAAVAEFGEANIVGIDLHTDESTPHVHVVLTPIYQEKLQAKHWLDGPRSMGAIRKRLHETIARRIVCEYTPGSPGGEPHDPQKAAGQPYGPQPEPGVWSKIVKVIDLADELKAAKSRTKDLEDQVQSLFSKLRREIRVGTDRYDLMQNSESKAVESDKEAAKIQVLLETSKIEENLAKHEAENTISTLENEVKTLKTEIRRLKLNSTTPTCGPKI